MSINGLTGKIVTPGLPAPRPSISSPAAPTAAEMADVENVISTEGCSEAMDRTFLIQDIAESK